MGSWFYHIFWIELKKAVIGQFSGPHSTARIAQSSPIGLLRYIKIQLDSEAVRTQTKESGLYVNIFHIHSNVFLLFLSSPPHYQAEHLICRKWPTSNFALVASFRGLVM